MDHNFITAPELLLVLALCGGPVYAVAAAALDARLRRRGVRPGRRLAAALGAAAAALPLTLALWYGTGRLPRRVLDRLPVPAGSAAVVVIVGVPALIASAVTFPLAARLARRGGSRPAA